MLKKLVFALAVAALGILSLAPFAFAQNIIPLPADLPPGSMSYSGLLSGDLLRDPNIIAAMIGVSGLLIGSVITILATYFIRWMDVRREDKRERLLIKQGRKEKEYQMKQELYRNFLGELAQLETFDFPGIDDFRRAWTRMEVKVDLVASPRVRDTKEKLQKELLALAEKNLKAGKAAIEASYMKTRDELLDAIREDIDILQQTSKK